MVVKDHNAFINRLKDLDKSYEEPNKVLLVWGCFKPYHGNISKHELNSISATRPIIVWQRSCHEFYLNDAALKHFNITEADFNKMPGYCDYQTGHVFETGMFVVTKPVPDFISNPAQFSKGLEMMTDVIHKGGLTTICEQGFPQVDLNLEQSLISKKIKQENSNSDYFPKFFDHLHVGMRYKKFKVLTHKIEDGASPIQQLAIPHIYNLTVNPDEDIPYNYEAAHTWVLYKVFEPKTKELNESLKKDSVPLEGLFIY